MVYFRIRTDGYTSGWMSDVGRTLFREESRRLFQELGWTFRVGGNGAADTVTKDEALRLTVLNHTDGTVDKATLRFKDILGIKQIPGNPHFKDGLVPIFGLTGTKQNGMPTNSPPWTAKPCGRPPANTWMCSGSGRKSVCMTVPRWPMSALRCGAR